MEPKKLLPEDPETAELRTVELWVSRNGKAFQFEDLARLDGSTHRRCNGCGVLIDKNRGYTVCVSCKEEWELEVHKNRKRTAEFERLVFDDKYYDEVDYLLDDLGLEFEVDGKLNPELEKAKVLVAKRIFPKVCLHSILDDFYMGIDIEFDFSEHIKSLENKLNEALKREHMLFFPSNLAFDWEAYYEKWKNAQNIVKEQNV